jgi:hypothetical protein
VGIPMVFFYSPPELPFFRRHHHRDTSQQIVQEFGTLQDLSDYPHRINNGK